MTVDSNMFIELPPMFWCRCLADGRIIWAV